MVKIGIFGGSRIEHQKIIPELRQVGKLLVDSEIVITGASPGYPYEVVQETYVQPRKVIIIGISPFASGSEHLERGLIVDSHDHIFYTGLGTPLSGNQAYHARNHINTALSEKALILPGREGTLNELELCIKQRKSFVLFSEIDKDWDRRTEEMIKMYEHQNYSREVNCRKVADFLLEGKNE